jgi:hypothetical protein
MDHQRDDLLPSLIAMRFEYVVAIDDLITVAKSRHSETLMPARTDDDFKNSLHVSISVKVRVMHVYEPFSFQKHVNNHHQVAQI